MNDTTDAGEVTIGTENGRITIEAEDADGDATRFAIPPEEAVEVGYTIVDKARGVDQ